MDATSGKAPASNIPRPGQSKKKSVRWAEEDKLNMIKVVEKLVYGDEFGNEITTSVSFSSQPYTILSNSTQKLTLVSGVRLGLLQYHR